MNSKNEYWLIVQVQVQVSEDRYDKKKRAMQEDEEEKEYQATVCMLRKKQEISSNSKMLGTETILPAGRSILELMKMNRKTAEKAGPEGKRRRLNEEDTAIYMHLEKIEERSLRSGKLRRRLEKDRKRMVRRCACSMFGSGKGDARYTRVVE